MSEVLDYVDDILTAADKIYRYTEGMDYDEFVENDMAIDAVLRNFEVIGEAAKNVPAEVRDDFDAVPWTVMAGMRDKLITGMRRLNWRSSGRLSRRRYLGSDDR